MLRGVYPEPLRSAQGRSQRKGERAQHDICGAKFAIYLSYMPLVELGQSEALALYGNLARPPLFAAAEQHEHKKDRND